MQAPLPLHNRPAMSSSTKQNSLLLDTQCFTLRTSRQRAAGPWTRWWSHWNIYRGVFCCFCAEWLKGTGEGGLLFTVHSPSGGLVVKQEVTRKDKRKQNKSWVFKWDAVPRECLYVYLARVCLCSAWSVNILIRRLESYIIHQPLYTQTATPLLHRSVSRPDQTVFVKHVRVTEQHRSVD